MEYSVVIASFLVFGLVFGLCYGLAILVAEKKQRYEFALRVFICIYTLTALAVAFMTIQQQWDWTALWQSWVQTVQQWMQHFCHRLDQYWLTTATQWSTVYTGSFVYGKGTSWVQILTLSLGYALLYGFIVVMTLPSLSHPTETLLHALNTILILIPPLKMGMYIPLSLIWCLAEVSTVVDHLGWFLRTVQVRHPTVLVGYAILMLLTTVFTRLILLPLMFYYVLVTQSEVRDEHLFVWYWVLAVLSVSLLTTAYHIARTFRLCSCYLLTTPRQPAVPPKPSTPVE